MLKKDLRGRIAAKGGMLLGRFKGIAAILAERADLNGRLSTHYSVTGAKGESAGFQEFRICILFSRKTNRFVVLQSFEGRPHRNSFSVDENGEVVSFCDHLPNKAIMEAILDGGRLPTSLEPFDLEMHTEPDGIQTVKALAVDAVEKLGRYGKLDKNLNPEEWRGRGL